MRIQSYLLVLLLSFFPNRVFTQDLISAKTDSLIQQGIRLSIAEEYGRALDVFVSMEQEMPHNPVGYFFHAAVLHTRMMDYERYDEVDKFEKLLRKTLKLSRKFRSEDPWADFLIGGAYGYLAFHQGKQKKLIEAFRSGQRSIDALESAMSRDSTIVDALVGLGTYNYYRSKFSRYLSWMPFVSDNREESIAMIAKAMERSTYSKYSAMNALIWIYLDEERYEKVDDLLKTAMSEFPDSRIFLWAAAKHARATERWDVAEGFYRKILKSFEEQRISSPYNEISCYKGLIEVLTRRGDEQKVNELCKSLHKLRRETLNEREKDKRDEAYDSCEDCCEISRFVEAE